MIALISPINTNNLAMNNTKKPTSARSHQRQHQHPSSSYQYVVSGGGGNSTNIKRIRTPHPHDVLCGRGGGINSHPGNKVFRNWVRERKESYNLALSKIEKANVAREIVDIVRGLNPPGRFLTRGSGNVVYWIEIDDNKAMAKTSQALREGAPAIRSKAKLIHHDDIDDDHEDNEYNNNNNVKHQHNDIDKVQHSNRRSTRTKNKAKRMKITSTNSTLTQNLLKKHAHEAISELRASNNMDSNNATVAIASPQESNGQQVNDKSHVNVVECCVSPEVGGNVEEHETPSLIPVSMDSVIPSSFPGPNNGVFDEHSAATNNPFSRKRPLPRLHSLAFSDANDEDLAQQQSDTDTFNDPFALDDDDIEIDQNLSSAIEGNPDLSAARSNIVRQHSTSLSSLHLPRSTSIGNESSRSLMSGLSDLPDACAPKFQHYYDWTEGMQEVRDAAIYSSAFFPSLQFYPTSSSTSATTYSIMKSNNHPNNTRVAVGRAKTYSPSVVKDKISNGGEEQ